MLLVIFLFRVTLVNSLAHNKMVVCLQVLPYFCDNVIIQILVINDSIMIGNLTIHKLTELYSQNGYNIALTMHA